MAPPHQSGPPGVRVLDLLRDEGRLTAPQYESVYHQAKRSGERVEEMLLESSAVTEPVLLKAMAAVHRTRFIGTERLAHASLDPSILARVPRKLAERLQCVPILHDAKTNTLSVVAYDLDHDVETQLKVATSARDVHVLVARPAAVRAAIRRHYAGDASAFAPLLGAAAKPAAAGLEAFEPRPAPRGPTDPATKASRVEPISIAFEAPDPLQFGIAAQISSAPTPKPSAAAAAGRPAPAIEPILIEMPRLDQALHFDRHLETVHVLVTLLEGERPGLRGHSSSVGRLARRLAEALHAGEAEADAVVLTAYLHDLGKGGALHLTALNVSRFDGHLAQAQRAYLAPVRTMESTRLPETVVLGLTHLHERFDGQGFPGRLAGRDVPLAARIVAVAETYADLVENPQNPYRRRLTAAEAFDVVQQLEGTLFDPAIVAALRPLVLGAATGAGEGGTRVLLVEPDPTDSALLELRLTEAGHGVRTVPSRGAAEAALAEERFDAVLSELELEHDDGFALLQMLRRTPRTRAMPFVFLSHRADRESVARGFELGASDFLTKPASPALVVAKVAQLLEGSPRRGSVGGFGGSLRDMGLPDVVQALANGRKSGLLKIAAEGQIGEIHFLDGAVADARFGARAREDAFYAMLALTDGDFSLDPAHRPGARVMQGSVEALLLEGMRRMDEGIG